MGTKKRTAGLLLNIFLPVLAGGAVYCFFSPDVIFVKHVDGLLGKGFHAGSAVCGNVFVRLVRNYLPDNMWAYSLVFALYLILGDNKESLMKIFFIAFSFSAIMEILQLTDFCGGTFDIFDILTEMLSELFAIFIIKNIFEEAS